MIRKTDVEIWKGLVETNKALVKRVHFLEREIRRLTGGICPSENITSHLDGGKVQRDEDSDDNILR